MKRTPVTAASVNRTLTGPKGFSANKAERRDQRRGRELQQYSTGQGMLTPILPYGEVEKKTKTHIGAKTKVIQVYGFDGFLWVLLS